MSNLSSQSFFFQSVYLALSLLIIFYFSFLLKIHYCIRLFTINNSVSLLVNSIYFFSLCLSLFFFYVSLFVFINDLRIRAFLCLSLSSDEQRKFSFQKIAHLKPDTLLTFRLYYYQHFKFISKFLNHFDTLLKTSF